MLHSFFGTGPHPAKSVDRWYLMIEGKNGVILPVSGKDSKGSAILMPEWHYFCDVAIDKAGNIYACGTEDSDDNFIVWSIDKDLNTRWVRKDLKFNYDDTGITLTNTGSLYLWNKKKHSLIEISSKDGSDVRKIEGKPVTKDNPYAFNMKGCGTLVSDSDGTILALIHNTVVRFSAEGKRVELWKGRKFGLFSSGLGLHVPESDPEWAPYLKETGSFPKRISSDYTKLNIGWDGYLYFMDKSSSDGEVAKYAADGSQLWSKYIPLGYKDCKPCVDANGNVYILGTNENSDTNLIRYNPYADKFETLLTDLKEGGVLDDERHLAVSPEGKIYIFDTYGGMKVYSPQMEMVYRSKSSEEDDNDVIESKKKAIEKDEEFD
jgi:hypothetical protein